MRRIAVTGGSGKLGKAVLADLVDAGYEVFNLDQTPPAPGSAGSAQPACPFIRIDLTDYGQVLSALLGVDDRYSGLDAVVHLAAVPAPGLLPNGATFANNAVTTYNVFAAARAAGIKNVVWASSETLLGLPFGPATPPPYLPVDERYPVRPESTYSLVKCVEEAMAEQFCRWEPELKMIGLRFSNVMDVADYEQFPSYDADPAIRAWNLWAYIDARDGAQAVRLALEADLVGLEICIIANADSVMTRSSAELAATVFPQVAVQHALGEHETLLSIEKARRLLGYEPKHSWRDHV